MSSAAGQASRFIIGLISDTHGLLRPDVFTALAGVDLLLHAGDVGGDEILDELGAIAPVHAVFGNTDPPGHPRLESRLERSLGDVTIHVSHGHELGSPTPEKLLAAYTADVIVYGHTHKPHISRHGSRLIVNPGAAGPRRFHLLPSVALLRSLIR
jgi:putative phosphoesterase